MPVGGTVQPRAFRSITVVVGAVPPVQDIDGHVRPPSEPNRYEIDSTPVQAAESTVSAATFTSRAPSASGVTASHSPTMR
jgi:hypothetical protein